MDINGIVALGIPGLILEIVMSNNAKNGFKGAQKFTHALAQIGGGTMKEGLLTLGLTGLLSYKVAEFGTEVVKNKIKERQNKVLYNQHNTRGELDGSARYTVNHP